ncbi:zinc ribbon domain-containing protein [Desulfocurvus sp. DL9XJH121]
MAESTDRKVFSMGTFAAYLTGEDKDSNMAAIKDMLGYMTQLEIDGASLPFAEAIAKAWIYEQNPELINIAGKADQFGQHVSVPVLPEDVTAQVSAIVAELKGTKDKNAEQAAKISDLEKKLADAQSKLKAAEAKVTTYEAQLGEGEKKLSVSEGKIDSVTGKVDDLIAKIEQVIAHGVVTAAAGDGGAAAPAASADAAAQDTPGEVSSDFGFGTDDSGGDSFGF